MNKSNLQKRLVEQAFERDANERATSITDQELKALQELSKKTGLTVDTLRIIKAKEGAFK